MEPWLVQWLGVDGRGGEITGEQNGKKKKKNLFFHIIPEVKYV